MTTPIQAAPPAARHALGLWVGLLGGPVAWFVQLNLGYALSWWACGFGRPLLPAHLATAACLAGAVVSGVIAARYWRAVRGWPSGSEAGALGRTRVMAVVGVMTGALFSVAIVAEWCAILLL